MRHLRSVSSPPYFGAIAFGMSSFLMTATLFGAANNPSADIRAVMSAQVAAWNRGDIEGFMEGYWCSDRTEFVSGDNVTHGWQTVRDRYRRKYDSRAKMGTLTFSEINVTTLGNDVALVVGRWRLVRT